MINIFKILQIGATVDDIDLAMTPIETFGFFECRGDMHRVRSMKERYYYFYVDNWKKICESLFHGTGYPACKGLSPYKSTPEVDRYLCRFPGKHGSYIHPCFDLRQGYVYTADRRKPGGYWFVDFRQARVFWASGTFAGGFGRLCRTERILSPVKL